VRGVSRRYQARDSFGECYVIGPSISEPVEMLVFNQI